MELNLYFDAVNFSMFAENSRQNWKQTLGAVVEKNTRALNDKNFSKTDVAIIGIPFSTRDDDCEAANIPDSIRKELYSLAIPGKVNIIDLGDLKQACSPYGNYLALRDVTGYLSESEVTALVIGGSEDFGYGICQAFREDKFFSFTIIDALLDVKKGVEKHSPDNYLTRIFNACPDIFQFSLLGYQRHYISPKLFSKIKGIKRCVGLGELRSNVALAESIFRNSDFAAVDFSTLKYSDTFGKKHLPNGLTGEEICQLTKYAGLNRRIKALALFEVSGNGSEINIKLAAQAAWYFIEGLGNQNFYTHEDKEAFEEHAVEVAQVENPLVFYRNIKTGQWWMQFRTLNDSFIYLACSEQEYWEATQNEIPEIWLEYVQKIDGILK